MDHEAIAEVGRKFKVDRFFLNAIRIVLSLLVLIPVATYLFHLFTWRGDDQSVLSSYLLRNGWYVLVSTILLILVNVLMNWFVSRARVRFGRIAYEHTAWFEQTHLSQETTGCTHFFNNSGELLYRRSGPGELFSTMHFMNRLYEHSAIPSRIFAHVLLPYAGGIIDQTFVPIIQVSRFGIVIFDLKAWTGPITLFDRGGYWYARTDCDVAYPAFINDDEMTAATRALSPTLRESDISVSTVLMDADSLEIEGTLPANRHIFKDDELSWNVKRIDAIRLSEEEVERVSAHLEEYRYPDEQSFARCMEAHRLKEEGYRRILQQESAAS